MAGLGFSTRATAESLADAFRRAGGNGRVTAVATAADKIGAVAIQEFSKTSGLKILAIDTATLTRQQTETQSEASFAARGTGSVAEAAALAAAGEGAVLLGPRVISDDGLATCALAEGKGA